MFLSLILCVHHFISYLHCCVLSIVGLSCYLGVFCFFFFCATLGGAHLHRCTSEACDKLLLCACRNERVHSTHTFKLPTELRKAFALMHKHIYEHWPNNIAYLCIRCRLESTLRKRTEVRFQRMCMCVGV